jgi:Peptidase MA superfamily
MLPLGGRLVAQQDQPVAIRVGQVTAVAWPGQLKLARELAKRAGDPAEWPGLGQRDPGPLRLIIVPDSRRLDSLSSGRAPSWGVGVAVPGSRTILLRADQGDLYTTLRHELAHLVLHQAVDVRVPLWFNEGYASWAAGEWDRLGALELNLAVVRGAVPDLRALDGALRGSATTADAAYALAVSAVTELARRNPSGSLTPLLDKLAAGHDFEASVLATTGLTTEQFDLEWQRRVKRQYSLATWLLAGGGWGIFALSLWALVRVRRRADRTRRAALDHGWDIAPEDAGTPELDRTPER